MLARREHSRAELRRKLAAAPPGEGVEPLLDDLSRLGLLSDERAAESFVRSRAGRFGRARLARELRERGVPDDLAAQALAAASGDELATARAVWLKKFGSPPANAREQARQVRFLQARGFTLEIILRVLREP